MESYTSIIDRQCLRDVFVNEQRRKFDRRCKLHGQMKEKTGINWCSSSLNKTGLLTVTPFHVCTNLNRTDIDWCTICGSHWYSRLFILLNIWCLLYANMLSLFVLHNKQTICLQARIIQFVISSSALATVMDWLTFRGRINSIQSCTTFFTQQRRLDTSTTIQCTWMWRWPQRNENHDICLCHSNNYK